MRKIIIIIACSLLLMLLIFAYYNIESSSQEKTPITQQQKQQFFSSLEPLIQQQNMKLKYEKAFLQNLDLQASQSQHHTDANTKKIKRLIKSYQLPKMSLEEALQELKIRVDQIPASLVLAQAAIASDWGRNDAAIKANNLFEQRCYTKDCGMSISQSIFAEDYQLQIFDNKKASISSYMKNLNTHESYQKFRQMRLSLRENKQALSGIKLAKTLDKNADKNQLDVEKIIQLIQQHQLE